MSDSSKKRTPNLRRRIAPRTPSQRPCLMWTSEMPEIKKKGIILDLNMYGLKVRTSEIYEIGQELYIQMMKNDEYTQNLGVPVQVTIIRSSIINDKYIDYGMKRIFLEIKKTDRKGQALINPSNNVSKNKITEVNNIKPKENNK